VGRGGQSVLQQEAGFDLYDLYRGDLGALEDTDDDGAAQDYGSCLAENLTGPTFSDAGMPQVGQGFIYLVTGRTAAGESDLGTASSGAPRPNVSDCTAVFGVPPVIHSLSATSSEQEVSCDLTTSLLGRVCTLVSGPGERRRGPRHVHRGTDESQVTPHTPPTPDVTGVIASLLGVAAGSLDIGLLDDGSTAVFSELQRTGNYGLNCTLDPQTCSCTMRSFPLVSGDTTGADTRFT
jgi:hypothetical protein